MLVGSVSPEKTTDSWKPPGRVGAACADLEQAKIATHARSNANPCLRTTPSGSLRAKKKKRRGSAARFGVVHPSRFRGAAKGPLRHDLDRLLALCLVWILDGED